MEVDRQSWAKIREELARLAQELARYDRSVISSSAMTTMGSDGQIGAGRKILFGQWNVETIAATPAMTPNTIACSALAAARQTAFRKR